MLCFIFQPNIIMQKPIPSLITLFCESYPLFSVLGKSIFYLHEHMRTHTQARAHQWNRSTIRRRRECRRRRLRRGSGRREAGQGGDHRGSYDDQGHRRAPSPLLPHPRLVCDEMPRRDPITIGYMYVLFFEACKYLRISYARPNQ